MKIDAKKLFINSIVVISLIVIVLLSAYVRSSTLDSKTVLDYDPWWYYRHAIEIMNNNLVPLKWDILSYYPPGRPYDNQLGWTYTMIAFFKVLSTFFKDITFLTVAKISPLIMVGLGVIPAFLLGRLVSNKWGGVLTALFVVLTPTYIGVSMAGYTDNDPVVVFYTLLAIYSIFLALIRFNENYKTSSFLKSFFKTIPFLALAIIVNILFVFNWGGAFFPLILSIIFLPILLIFRLVEQIIHERKFKINLADTVIELKSLIIPMAIIILFTSIISYLIGGHNLFASFLVLLGFTDPSQGLLVNISVAELQKVNIFTIEGLSAIASRLGGASIHPLLSPLLLFTFLLPVVIVIKILKKIKINFVEIFLLLWWGVTFYMILSGVRFSLSFSIAAAATAGYVIMFFLEKFKNYNIVYVSFLAFVLLLALNFVSDSLFFATSGSGMEVSQNWIDALEWLKKNADKDSLITTWWDPGHIIAGYTGLKVMADGAHCGPNECIPYNHNIRIQDMGHIFSTSDESDALKTLSKYKELSPEQCQRVRETFGGIVPKDACKPVTDIYLIASGDLIGKYYWLSYFGQGPSNAKNFYQIPLSRVDEFGNPIYGNVLVLVQKEDKLIPVYNNRFIFKEIVFFQNNQLIRFDFSNTTNMIDGQVWVSPDFGSAIIMEPPVRDAIFTKLYFWNGEGLKHFELVYLNSEVKIFKVKF